MVVQIKILDRRFLEYHCILRMSNVFFFCCSLVCWSPRKIQGQLKNDKAGSRTVTVSQGFGNSVVGWKKLLNENEGFDKSSQLEWHGKFEHLGRHRTNPGREGFDLSSGKSFEVVPICVMIFQESLSRLEAKQKWLPC